MVKSRQNIDLSTEGHKKVKSPQPPLTGSAGIFYCCTKGCIRPAGGAACSVSRILYEIFKKGKKPMNTLIINAQPDYRNAAHYSIQLMNHFIGLFKDRYPKDTLKTVNLAAEWIPRATCEELLTVRGKQIAQEPLTEQEEKIAARSGELLNDFMAFRRIVVVMPLHNFNIPSILKDYMDNVLVARKTFKYTPQGVAGLLTDGRRVLLLQASGSIYTNNDRYTSYEFSRMYLETVFTAVMGFDSFQIVRAQGTSKSAWKAERDMPLAFAQLDEEFEKFYA